MQDDLPVSATEPDWTRERLVAGQWQPGRQVLRAVRSYQAAKAKGGMAALILSRWWVLAHRFWSAVAGTDIPINARIGGGLAMPHPNGIVLHVNCQIGPNCLLFQQVTLAGDGQGGAPCLGGHVDVGAGAKIIGKISIGDHAKIGANAVVLCDVPAGATAVGIPAKILQPRTG